MSISYEHMSNKYTFGRYRLNLRGERDLRWNLRTIWWHVSTDSPV